MEDIKTLEDQLRRSKNPADKAVIADKIRKLKEKPAPETEKKIIPTRDASPVADHKYGRKTIGRGDVVLGDKIAFMP